MRELTSNVFCTECGHKVNQDHGQWKVCQKCYEMLLNGFESMSEYVNSEYYHGERWATVGANSSFAAMMEVHKLYGGHVSG